VKIVPFIRVACVGGVCEDVKEQNGWQLNKESDREGLVGRRRSELRKKLKGGCLECRESQSDGTALNGTAWSPLAVTGGSGREDVTGNRSSVLKRY
jgi:hypothetical protein